MEEEDSVKYLGVTLSNQLTWTGNTSQLVEKAHQRLFFLKKLKQPKLPLNLLFNFY